MIAMPVLSRSACTVNIGIDVTAAHPHPQPHRGAVAEHGDRAIGMPPLDLRDGLVEARQEVRAGERTGHPQVGLVGAPRDHRAEVSAH